MGSFSIRSANNLIPTYWAKTFETLGDVNFRFLWSPSYIQESSLFKRVLEGLLWHNLKFVEGKIAVKTQRNQTPYLEKESTTVILDRHLFLIHKGIPSQ